jgi:hypothetical protein
MALFRLQIACFTKLLGSEQQAGCMPAYYFAPALHEDVDVLNAGRRWLVISQAEIGVPMIARPDCLSVNSSQMIHSMAVSRLRDNGLMPALCSDVNVKFHVDLS